MNYLQLILAVLLLICLLDMPYGYYILIRFITMISFTVFAIHYYNKNQKNLMVVFGALALLFQPFIKIALWRVMWNIVDVFVAILLLGIYVFEKNTDKDLL